MFIPDPDFCFVHPGSRIQKQQQKRGVKTFFVLPFFAATNITKLAIILFWNWSRKNAGQFTKNYY
jgi:hypothetical protein